MSHILEGRIAEARAEFFSKIENTNKAISMGGLLCVAKKVGPPIVTAEIENGKPSSPPKLSP